MSRFVRLGSVVLLYALALTWRATPVIAEDASEQGRTMALAAVELARSGSYAEAIDLFEKAYELHDDPMILYNIGCVAAKANLSAKAREALVLYLEKEKDPERANRGRDALKEILASSPGWLRVTAPVEGAVVELDGAPMGRTPLARPLEVSPGKHALKVLAVGKLPFERVIEVGASESMEINAALEDEPVVVAFAVDPSETRIWIDGRVVLADAKSPMLLPPGRHELRAEADGYESKQESFEVAAGEKTKKSIALKKKPAEAMTTLRPLAVRPTTSAVNDLSGGAALKEKAIDSNNDRTLMWVLIGTGAAALVAGGVTAAVLLANKGGGSPTEDLVWSIRKPLEVGR